MLLLVLARSQDLIQALFQRGRKGRGSIPFHRQNNFRNMQNFSDWPQRKEHGEFVQERLFDGNIVINASNVKKIDASVYNYRSFFFGAFSLPRPRCHMGGEMSIYQVPAGIRRLWIFGPNSNDSLSKSTAAVIPSRKIVLLHSGFFYWSTLPMGIGLGMCLATRLSSMWLGDPATPNPETARIPMRFGPEWRRQTKRSSESFHAPSSTRT